MKSTEVLSATLDTSSLVLSKYLEDLSDADLMKRPGAGCNHIAWQLGHLINSEKQLLDAIAPGSSVELPAEFAQKHGKETIGDDNPANFYSKQEYLDFFEKVHAATKAALSQVSEADLDKAAPEHFRSMFPTIGHIYILIATHGLMHAGQLVPIRRELGKPIVI